MRLAFLVDQCIPLTGRHRTLRFFLDELQRQGHACRVYSPSGNEGSIAGAQWRNADRKNTGLLMGQRGRLRVGFRLDRPAHLTLRLRHRALRNHVEGSAPVRVTLSGQVVAPTWQPPGRWYEEEEIPLGAAAAGDHALTIEVDPRTSSLYSLLNLELIVREVR